MKIIRADLFENQSCLQERNLSLFLYIFIATGEIAIINSYKFLPSDLVAQSIEQRRSNLKVVGSIPTLVRVSLSLREPNSISRPNAHMVYMSRK